MAPWRSLGREELLDEEWLLAEVETVPEVEVLASVSSLPVGVALLMLDSIDPAGLGDEHAVLDYLRAAERIDAATAALKARARVALAGATASEQVLDELHVEAELATATRSSRYVAGMSIERARVLTTIFPAFLDALAEGAIAEAHCRTLVEKTRPVTDPVALAAIGRVLLPKAKRLAPGPFAREVATAIAPVRPRRGLPLHARSRAALGVDPGARGRHVATSAWSTTPPRSPRSRPRWTPTRMPCARSDARPPTRSATPPLQRARTSSGRYGDPRTAPCCTRRSTTRKGSSSARAAPMPSLRASWAPRPRPATSTGGPRRPTSRCSSSSTCRPCAARSTGPACSTGNPSPPRSAATSPATPRAFRRMVTDPVDGHLLDYGDQTYLPDPLRTYVLARDGGCRVPGCTTRDPRRHADGPRRPVPRRARPTPPTPAACASAHHQLKTSGYLHIENSAADGSCDWVTAWGQRIHIPARPFLHDPADDQDPDPPPPLEEPPF